MLRLRDLHPMILPAGAAAQTGMGPASRPRDCQGFPSHPSSRQARPREGVRCPQTLGPGAVQDSEEGLRMWVS